MLNTNHIVLVGAVGSYYIFNRFCHTFNADTTKDHFDDVRIFLNSDKMYITGKTHDCIYDANTIPNSVKRLRINNVNLINQLPEISDLQLTNIQGFRPKIPNSVTKLTLNNFEDIDPNSDAYKIQSRTITNTFLETFRRYPMITYNDGRNSMQNLVRQYFCSLDPIINNIKENGNIELSIILNNILLQHIAGKKREILEEKIIESYRDFIPSRPLVFQIPDSVNSLYLFGRKNTNYNSIIQRSDLGNSLEFLYIQDIDIDLELFVPVVSSIVLSNIGIQKNRNLKTIVLQESTYIQQKNTIKKLFNAGIFISVVVTNVMTPIDDFPYVDSIVFPNENETDAILYSKLNHTRQPIKTFSGYFIYLRDRNNNIHFKKE